MSFILETVRDRTIWGNILNPKSTKDNSSNISEKFRLFRILAVILNFGRNGKRHLSQKEILPKCWPPLVNKDYSFNVE